jgi:two-component system, LytTR family, response regulator
LQVMLVDDEQPCLDELEYLLDRHEDIEITGMFINPLRALSVALRREPDVIFLDINMAQMNGIELAEKIRSLNDKVQIVFVTAHTKLFKEAKRVGSHAFLLKPVSKAKLKAVLDDLKQSKQILG